MCSCAVCFYTERETPLGQCCEKPEVETPPCTDFSYSVQKEERFGQATRTLLMWGDPLVCFWWGCGVSNCPSFQHKHPASHVLVPVPVIFPRKEDMGKDTVIYTLKMANIYLRGKRCLKHDGCVVGTAYQCQFPKSSSTPVTDSLGRWLFSGSKTLSKCSKHWEHSGALILYKLTKKNTPLTLLYGEITDRCGFLSANQKWHHYTEKHFSIIFSLEKKN